MIAKGIRNNNPGNLVYTKNNNWVGKLPLSKNTDKHFEQFYTMEHGIRAMLLDLIHDIKKGKNTVRKLITEYAPPFENNTSQYITDVCRTIGIKADDKITSINEKFLTLLAKAIIKKENGEDSNLVKDSQIKSALGMLGNVSDQVLKVTINTVPYALLIPVILLFYTVFTVTL